MSGPVIKSVPERDPVIWWEEGACVDVNAYLAELAKSEEAVRATLDGDAYRKFLKWGLLR